MDREISRRDFLNGVGIAIGASLLPGCSRDGEPQYSGIPSSYYPPARTGMRGSHAGSFEVAHATIQGARWDVEVTDEHFDLVVVGAGISGLSAAYIYRRDVNPDARILLLDNHDDFGGHAKRNEFTLDGQTYIGYGGTMVMESPRTYPDVSRQVIRELGIEYERAGEFYEGDVLSSHGAGRTSFFDKETFGNDVLATGKQGFGDSIDHIPMSSAGKDDLQRLYADETDYLAGKSTEERREILRSHSWREYLAKYADFGDEVLAYVQKHPHGVWAIGADALPAWMAWAEGYPGFAGMDLGFDLGSEDTDTGERFYFPDGNASVARLLTRNLIPSAAPGDSMEDSVTARFNYEQLDLPENSVRLRLNSTVVDLRHQDGNLDGKLDVTYVAAGEARTLTASKVVWAGYHAMLPYICPDLPDDQVKAFRGTVRAPLSYTNVLIRNWRSLAELGMRRAFCPGSFFQTIMVTHPVSMGDYQFTQSPDEPVILHMQHIPLEQGLSAPEQFDAGKRFLLETSFETFERNVRDQLGRMLGAGGFDPARDIAGITVNRWPHGYAYSVDEVTGEVAWWPQVWQHERRPWVDARQRVGNIVFAGTDSSSNAMTESAIEQAHRAVQDLT